MGFYAIETESWANMSPILLQLRRRWENMEVRDPENAEKMVRASALVRYIYTDTCCQGGDPTKHPVVDIFPHVMRAPFADGYHKTDLLLKATHTGAPDTIRQGFARDHKE